MTYKVSPWSFAAVVQAEECLHCVWLQSGDERYRGDVEMEERGFGAQEQWPGSWWHLPLQPELTAVGILRQEF